MVFLPIVGRELRVAMRRKWTYWTRVGLGILAFLFSLWSVQAEFQFRNSSSVGRSIFNTITGLSFAFCLASGAWITADAISRERREGTLGLLFLTDLKGYDVVLGKLAATSLNAVYGLLAVFPVLALSILFGGITAGEFWRMGLALLLTLFFSLSAGLFISSVIQEQSKTIGWTLLLIGVVTLGPMAWSQLTSSAAAGSKLTVFSPAYLVQTALDAAYNNPGNSFWSSFLFLGFLTFFLLLMAAWITPRSWQERSGGPRKTNWRHRWQEWTLGNSGQRQRFRGKLLDVNPVFWLAARHRLKAVLVWVFLALGGVAWGIGLARSPRLLLDISTCTFISATVHFVLKVWAASEAGHLFATSRQNGSLELLLTTPLKVREILQGQILALRWQFLKPVLVTLAMDVALLAVAWPQEKSWAPALSAVAGMIFLILDLYTVAYVAMWLGLKTRHASRASTGAIGRVLILPWAGILFLMIFGGGFPRWEGVVIAAILTRAFVDYVMFFIYYSNLHQEFRKLAADESRTPADYNQDFGLLNDPLQN